MLNWIITGVACCGLVLGIVALLSPIPIGVLILGVSTATLIYVSPRSRRLIQVLRHRYLWLNHKFHWLEARLEQKYHKLWQAFIQTRPTHHQHKNQDSGRANSQESRPAEGSATSQNSNKQTPSDF